MKKQALITVFFVVSIFFSANVFAQFPISSYDTPVAPGSFFTETHATAPTMSSEKRKMNIDVTDPGDALSDSKVTFIAYSLDMQSFKGPFTVQAGHSKKINIDKKRWGVYVLNVEGRCNMSVYTNSNDAH